MSSCKNVSAMTRAPGALNGVQYFSNDFWCHVSLLHVLNAIQLSKFAWNEHGCMMRHVAWQSLHGLLSVLESFSCNEVYEINLKIGHPGIPECPIFKWIAISWFQDKAWDTSSSIGHQSSILHCWKANIPPVPCLVPSIIGKPCT